MIEFWNSWLKNQGSTFSAFDIAARIGANRNSVGPLLSKLVSERKVEKRGHGMYSANRAVASFVITQESPDERKLSLGYFAEEGVATGREGVRKT